MPATQSSCLGSSTPIATCGRSLIRNLGTTSGADVAGHYTPDDVYAATLVGLLQALEAGITTVVDWCDVFDDAARLEAALSAHADSGREPFSSGHEPT